MPTYCSVKKSILLDAKDEINKELIKDRNTYTFINDNTIRINNKQDNAKTKVVSGRTQAYEIANKIKNTIYKNYGDKVVPVVEENVSHEPMFIKLFVKKDYLDYEYNKLPKERQNESLSEDEINELYSDREFDRRADTGDTFLSTPSKLTSSKASPATIKVVKEFLKTVGIDIQKVDGIVVDGIKQDADACADLTSKLIKYIDGRESSSLPEEAMHMAVAIVKQTNPELYKQLLKEINDYTTYKSILSTPEYVNNPLYRKDGKPDIQKLKDEAIGKVLAETIIKKLEGKTEKPELLAKTESWWDKIINWLKQLVQKSGMDKLSTAILKGESIGTASDINENNTFLQANEGKNIYDKLNDIHNQIIKTDDGYSINGTKIKNRVTDLVKQLYKYMFTDRQIDKGEYESSVDNLKAEKGTHGHADIEHLLKDIFLDKNGYLKNDEEIDFALNNDEYISQLNPNDNDAYNILRDNLRERLTSYPKDTRFMSELMVYSPKMNLAGTIDFIAIMPNGKVDVLDWKFMDLNTEKFKDVPWYKIKAWNKQMDLYRNILESNGVNAKDFRNTMMVPIKVTYTYGNKKENVLPQLQSVEIGDANIKNIKEDYLIPVATETQKTGNKQLDKLIEKLYNEYKKLTDKKVFTPEDRQRKNELLNATFSSIRHLQMQEDIVPLISQAQLLNKNINLSIEEYNNKWKDANPNDFSEHEINSFVKTLAEHEKNVNIYTNLDIALQLLFPQTLTDEEKQLKNDLRDTVESARHLKSTLYDAQESFVNDIIAKKYDVDDYLNPEAPVKGLARIFNSASTLQTNAMQVFYKMTNSALKRASFDLIDEVEKLKNIKNNYEQWAKNKGLTIKNQFNILTKKDSNELIDQYEADFYNKLKSAIAKRDYDWIKSNINTEEIEKLIEDKKQQLYKYVDEKIRVGTDEEINEQIKKEKFIIDKQYDTSENGAGWFQYNIVKQSPTESWLSKDWLELNAKGNEPAKALYDYIIERNKLYESIGYIPDGRARTFLPSMQKSLTEKLVFGGNITLGEQFLKSISLDDDSVGFAKIDPTTGEKINTIPKYFISQLEKDYSTDLFKTMALYNEYALKFKYLSDIEDQARALLHIEKNKQTIVTSFFGKAKMKDGEIQYANDNTKNYELLDAMVKATLFGQRYVNNEDFDLMLGKIGGFGKKINNKIGMKLLPEDLEGRPISLNKSIHTINSFMRNKTQGLSLLSPIIHVLGGNAQSLVSAGTYFTATDLIAAQAFYATHMLPLRSIEEKQKFVAAMNYFLPLTENSTRHYTNSLSISKLTQHSIQELCMATVNKAYSIVELSNFRAFMQNTIVIDNNIYNTREYLRSTDKYKDMYAGTEEERKQRVKHFEEDVKRLNEENNILKHSTIENNKLKINGVDQHSPSVIKLINKINNFNKDALGSMSEDDRRLAETNSILNSMLMFKHWIPRTVAVRFGGMLYNSATEAYEWGRVRTLFDIMQVNVFKSIKNLKDTLQANDKGVEYLQQQYEKKKQEYEQNTGKEFKINSSQFSDLYRRNLRNNLKDVIFITGVLSLYLTLKANAPGKNEDESVKNQYRFMLKAADKLRDEMTFFYDASTFQNLLGTSIFPSLQILTDFEKAFSEFLKYNWGIVTGNQKDVKDAHVIKYIMKEIPFANQLSQYLPILYPDLAKNLDIKLHSSATVRQ